MVRCGSDIGKAFEAEPGLKALLPPDVGGEGKPLKDLIRESKLASSQKPHSLGSPV